MRPRDRPPALAPRVELAAEPGGRAALPSRGHHRARSWWRGDSTIVERPRDRCLSTRSRRDSGRRGERRDSEPRRPTSLRHQGRHRNATKGQPAELTVPRFCDSTISLNSRGESTIVPGCGPSQVDGCSTFAPRGRLSHVVIAQPIARLEHAGELAGRLAPSAPVVLVDNFAAHRRDPPNSSPRAGRSACRPGDR